MAAVHGLLSTNRWQPVPLRSLIAALFIPDCRGRIEVVGPPVEIPASQAQALGMVINELMINSYKHGALLAPAGRVKVSWCELVSASGEPGLSFRWQESGGSPIEMEPVAGVGSSLINGLVKAELRGRAELSYSPQGANHRLEFVLVDESSWLHTWYFLFGFHHLPSSMKCKKSWTEDFAGSSVAKTFSGAVVQELLDFGETMLRNSGQIRPLGKELTDQTIGVFVRASLPRTVRIGKIDLQRGLR